MFKRSVSGNMLNKAYHYNAVQLCENTGRYVLLIGIMTIHTVRNTFKACSFFIQQLKNLFMMYSTDI